MVFTEELGDAARNGDTAAIQEWFSTGTRDPDEKDECSETLLTCAASGGSIEAMLIILAHGASVHASNGSRETPLIATVCSGQLAAAIVLLDHGAEVDARTNGNGSTPLMKSGVCGHCEMIRLLLHRGADLDVRDSNGKTALDIARRPLARLAGWLGQQSEAADLLADVRRAGGWQPYVRYPRFRLLMLRILAEQGRAETQDPLLRRLGLFPAGPPAPESTKRPREAYRAQKGGLIPRGIFMHIAGYWRSNRDYLGPA